MTLALRTVPAAVTRAAVSLALLSSAAVGAADPQLAWAWRSGAVQGEDLVVGDFDGDGLPETIASDGYGWRSIVVGPDGYRVERGGPHRTYSDFVDLAAVDALGDCRPELVVTNRHAARIEVWDVRHPEPLATCDLPGTTLVDLLAGDLDGDGEPELAVLYEDPDLGFVLDLLDAATGVSQSSIAVPESSELAVGQLDADAALEIVVAALDGTATALDGATLALDWSHDGGQFGASCAVGDFDDDGRDEIATLEPAESEIVVFDPGDLVDGVLWTLANDASFGARLGAGDLDGDGRAELLLSAVAPGGRQIQARSGVDGVLLGGFVQPRSVEPHALVAADFDGDDAQEIGWILPGASDCGDESFGTIDSATFAAEGGLVEGLPTRFVAGRQLDAGGRPELLAALECWPTVDAPRGGAVLDGGTGEARRHLGLPNLDADPELWGLAAGALDGDPQDEVAVVYFDSPDRRVAVVDGTSGATQWDLAIGGASGVEVADLGGGGVALVLRRFAQVVEARAASDGALLWTSEIAAGIELRPDGLVVGNVDADPTIEIVTYGNEGLALLSGATGALEREIALTGVTSAALLDVDGDTDLDLVAVGSNGLLRVVDPKTGTIGSQLDVFDPQNDIPRIAAAKGLLDATSPVVALAHDGRLHLVDLSVPEVVWSSAEPAPVESLAVADADGDGKPEIVAAGEGRIALYSMPDGLIYADGFERGHLGGWSASSAAPGCP